MKQHFSRMIAAAAALILGLAVLSGCEAAIGNSDQTTAVVLQGKKVSFAEAKLYIYASQYMIEKDSEAIISYMYQSYDDFWDYEQGGDTYYHMNTIEGINKLLQTKRLLLKAQADGIALTAEELQKVEDAIVRFREEESRVVAASGCSDELLRQYITENALAVKTYLAMVADVDTNFDQETFRRKNVEGIYVTALTEKPVPESESGEADGEEAADPEPYTEEEQTAAREEAAVAIKARVKSGEAIADIVSDFAESETVKVYSTGSLNLSSEDAAEEGADLTSYRHLGWTLSTGQTESIDLPNSSTGVVTTYILRCVNDDDPDLRASAEKSELASRKTALFGERYSELQETYSKYHVYENVISSIKKVIPMYESELFNPQQTAE